MSRAICRAVLRRTLIELAKPITGPDRRRRLTVLAHSAGVGLSTLYRWMTPEYEINHRCRKVKKRKAKRRKTKRHAPVVTVQALLQLHGESKIREVIHHSRTLREAAAALGTSVTSAWRLSRRVRLPSRRRQPTISDDAMRAAIERYTTRTAAAKALGVAVQRVSERAKRLGYPDGRQPRSQRTRPGH